VRCRKQRLAGDSQEVIRDPAMKLAGAGRWSRHTPSRESGRADGQRPCGLGDQATEYHVTEASRCQLGPEYGEVVDRQRSPDDREQLDGPPYCVVELGQAATDRGGELGRNPYG
jgi:hypothetical protein